MAQSMNSIALLRGVNVGGRQMVAMSDLRNLLTKLGFGEARSLLQSGNLVFQAGDQTAAELEALLELETEKRLKIRTSYFVRSEKEWKRVISQNPFHKEAEVDPAHLVLMLLKDAPKPKSVETLRESITGPELVHVAGRQAYIVYPAGIGTSRLTNTAIEAKLGTRGTARNWNTVLKLAACACGEA
jgi:uncharacterized protein (DUF1697 family)